MIDNLPVLLLKKLVLLPYQDIRLEISAEISKKIIDLSKSKFGSKVLVICPDEIIDVELIQSDLPNVGILSKIKSSIELPNGNYRVTLSGLNRVNVKSFRNSSIDSNILEANIKRIYIEKKRQTEEEALLRSLKTVVKKYMESNPDASNSVSSSINNLTDLDMLTDVITNYLPFDTNKKIHYMNDFDYLNRASELIKDINLELEVLSIETKIDDEIRESFNKEQRDFILKQKISKLNEQLGITSNRDAEVLLYENKVKKLDVSEKTKKKLLEEVKKYAYTSETNPDASVIRNYLETTINLPWNYYSEDEEDIKKIKKSLDQRHYEMEEAKNRIIEFIAIKKNSNKINAPIICLVGPPGTGKTTLGMSIATALNREFYKINVGGMNDATELTGHKRTYLGSSPGKIIQGIKKCGTSNPVILIDEVDKICYDANHDPSAVLLEILDPSQNNAFVDNYIEEPFNLSQVLFILTANDIKSIPSALRDRLEIIQINSYTEFEKINIAKKYLIPNIIEEYNANKIKLSDEILLHIIDKYTKESGVREFDRLLRKIYRNSIIDENKTKSITASSIKKILGPIKYDTSVSNTTHFGSSSALGVTPYGGVIISIESILVPGTGKLVMTGNLDDSIKESAQIALNFINHKAKEYKIDIEKLLINDVHVNALNYSIRKAGTSGGLAIASAFVSLLLEKNISPDTCFTGEITLHGDINRVGGIKEKIIGAYNNNYKNIYIPLSNQFDLESVPKDIKDNVTIKCVSSFDEVFSDLFKKRK